MNSATFSSKFRFGFVSGVLALTAGLFAAGCGSAETSGTTAEGEKVDQSSQAIAAATPMPPIAAGVRTYPPHGYPCLGCHPCGGTYCDNYSNMVVASGDGTPVSTDLAKSEGAVEGIAGDKVETPEALVAAPTPMPPIPVGIRTYPPHGYPCLGCHPCGTSYCDNDNVNKVVCTGDGTPVSSASQSE